MEQFSQLNTKLEQIWAIGKTLEGNQGTVLESLTHSAQKLLKVIEMNYREPAITKAIPDEHCAGAMPDPSKLPLVLFEMEVYELIFRVHGQFIRMPDAYEFKEFAWGVDTFDYTLDRQKLSHQCREALQEVIGIAMRIGVNKSGIRKRAMELWASLMQASTVVEVENRRNDYFEFIHKVKAAIEAHFVDEVDGVLLFVQKLAH